MARTQLLFIANAHNQDQAIKLARREIKKKKMGYTITKVKLLQKRPKGTPNTYALYGRPSKR